MKIPSDEVKTWEQLSMFGGGVVELTFRIGLAPHADHAQFQIESRDPSTDELLMLSSRHHVTWSEVFDELERWQATITSAVRKVDEPF